LFPKISFKIGGVYGLFDCTLVTKVVEAFYSIKKFAEDQMTYKEFKRHVFTIYNEDFNGEDSSPIDYGIQRAHFEEKKLHRLIELAEQTEFSTAKRKVAGWHRQLERVQQIKARLELRKSETLSETAFRDRLNQAVPINIPASRRVVPVVRVR
jgi:hypothetical protein